MRKKYFFTMLLVLTAMLLPTKAHADFLTVADSTATSDPEAYTFIKLPTFPTTTQMIYPAWMLSDMDNHNINSLTFYVNNAFSESIGGITVQLSEVTDSVTSSTAVLDHSNADVVYTGSVSAPNGQLTINFTQPYLYSGGNLMVTIETNGTSNANSTSLFYGINRTNGTLTFVSFLGMEMPYPDDILYKATFDYSAVSSTECGRPGTLNVSNLTGDSATISWGPSSNGSTYVVSLNDVALAPVYDTFIVLSGLSPATTYTVSVVTDCGDTTSLSRSTTFTTLCAAVDLPWSCDFENIGTSSMPLCWSLPIMFSYSLWGMNFTFPTVQESASAHSGGNVVYLGYIDSAVCMAATPQLNHNANGLEVSFWAAFDAASSLTVGMMTNPDDTSTFVPVMTIESDSASIPMQEYIFYTEGLEIEGNVLVAFKSFNTVILDDVTISEALTCHRPEGTAVANVTFDSATLSWSGDEDGIFVVELTNENTGEVTVYDNLTDTVLALANLNHATDYSARVAALCGEDTTMWAEFPPFSTFISCYTILNANIDNLDSTSVTLSWEYSDEGRVHQGVEIVLTDLTYPENEPQVEFTAGTSITINDLNTNHLYSITMRTVCDELDTSADVVLSIAPVGLPCAQIDDTPTQPTNDYPIHCYYKYSYCQSIYPAEEVGDMDTIYGIAFRYTGNSIGSAQSLTYRTVDVYLTETTDAILSNNITANLMTKVLSNGTVTVGGQPGWINILFDTPYAYDGGNLVVTIDDNTGSFSVSYYWSTHQASNGSCLYYSTDNSNLDPFSTLNLAIASSVPDIRIFGNCDNPITPEPQPQPDTCYIPTNLHSVSVTETTVTLDWTAGGSETQWQLQVNSNEPVDVNAHPYTVNGLTANTTYSVKVRALCNDTTYSDWSTAISVTTANDTTPGPVDTNSIGNVSGTTFALYPNPASTRVTVEVGDNNHVSIIDMNGRTIGEWKAADATLDIDLTSYARGAYFIRVTSNTGTAVRKLIIK